MAPIVLCIAIGWEEGRGQGRDARDVVDVSHGAATSSSIGLRHCSGSAAASSRLIIKRLKFRTTMSDAIAIDERVQQTGGATLRDNLELDKATQATFK